MRHETRDARGTRCGRPARLLAAGADGAASGAARPLRRRGSDRRRPGLRADLRRRAAPAGHAGDPRSASPARRDGDVLPRRRAGRQAPSLAREIVAAGHRIGLHCDRHRNLLRLAPAQVNADIDRAQARIEDATGVAIGLYRPPYGIFNLAAVLRARRSRWRALLWTHWGRDWEARATPASIAGLAGSGLAAGSVVLLHDADDYGAIGSWRRTLGALPLLLDRLEQLGLQTVAA